MKKVRVGLIGVGGICKIAHMRGYVQMEDVEIAAICDIQPQKMEEFKERYAMPDVPCYTDYRELLKNEQVDYVDICTPNCLHSIIAVDALNSGVHVLCEKPDAVSVAEAERMKEAAERNGKKLMVIRNNRFRNTAAYLKQYVDDGCVGEIYCGRCGWTRRRGIPGKGGWFTTKEQSGGGPLIDLGVHMIDLAVWLMGNPKPVAVSGCTYTKFADSDISDSEHSDFGEKNADGIFDVEDLAMGFIRFDNGACLQIEFSWASNISDESLFVELRGTKAGILFKNGEVMLATERNGCLEDIVPRVAEGDPHMKNIRHFIDVIRGEADPVFTPQQGLDMIKILDGIYRSAETGREVVL